MDLQDIQDYFADGDKEMSKVPKQAKKDFSLLLSDQSNNDLELNQDERIPTKLVNQV